MRGNSLLGLLAAVCMAMAVEAAALPRRFDSRSDKIMGQMDVFSQTTERRRVCSYKNSTYEEGSIVVTEEPCLKCKCLRGSLVCYLRVCPVLPDPPPPQCVLLLRKGACCSELICEDRGVQTNHISRADISAEELPSNGTYGDGCIANGTLYASGSAMWTDRPCEYCYCIAGKERCVRPRCLPSPDGCTPRRVPHSCCPVRYDCKHELHHLSTTTTMSAMSPGSKIKGCEVEGVFYPEGEKVTSLIKSRCDNCFCMRGLIRCVPLSCAPPLLGCTPIILPGECCASSYNCSKRIADMGNNNELPFISENGQEQDTIVNERSFPDDTPLTPSQIAEILLNGDGRILRKIENKNSTSSKNSNTTKINLKKSNSTIDNIKLNMTSTTTAEPLETTTLPFTESDDIFTTDDTDFTTWTESVNSENESTPKDSNPIENTTNGVLKEENTTAVHKISNSDSDENKFENEDVSDKSKTFINDTVNCNTELSMLNITELETVENDFNITGYNDTEERILYSSINNLSDTDAEETNWKIDSSRNKTDIETSTHADINPKFPSTSLIIPKDDDIFMVNVSTYVRTNTSVVTLRPVAAIPPEIEALLNISLKKNSQKDDYYDYDYKSSLPPSLPNLEIIPFLAIDAVVKSDEIDHDKSKEIDHYATAYPDEEKSYLGSFSTIPREKYNATIYPYINENYNPTTFPPYSEEKYLRSPVGHLNNFNRNQVIYKQHIDDKFQATTYKTILNDKFDENQYGIDKFDATVYPSLTLEDSATDNPTFAYNNRNLFSPPSETEGGFLPREPSLLGSYFNMGYSGSKDVPNPVTDSTLMVTDQTKPNSDDCLSNGRKYKNGELITEANACVICFCYYGDIHCQDPECPPIKPGCRRIVEKSSNSCCGIEICNDTTETNATVNFEKDVQQPPELVTISDRIDKPDPFKDVIRTETAPDLESLIGDMLPHYSTSSTTIRKPQITKKSTVNLLSTEQSTVAYKPSTTPLSTTREEVKETTEVEISTEYVREKSSTSEPIVTTIIDDNTTEEDEEDVFSFDNVLKLLLGDTDTTTKRHTTVTTRRPTSSITTPKIISTSLRYPTTPVTTRSILTTAANFFKNTYKNSFSKPNRTSINVIRQKNYTRPMIYPTNQLVIPPIQPFKKMPISHISTEELIMPISHLFTEEPKSPISKKPTTTQMDSSLPFGAGLLKLAGCNIYGRMYRVGKIISELSGPCLECMCTEVGVQCTPLTC